MILPDHMIRNTIVREPRTLKEILDHKIKLGDLTIRPTENLDERRVLYPWHERTKHRGMSFGLSMGGYDVRIAESITLGAGTGLRSVLNAVTRRGNPSFSLASTLEHFVMPDDLLAIVHDKSTWARLGLTVQNTVIEPGWHGFLTLEINNQSSKDVRIEAGDPIAQIVFHQLAAPPQAVYQGKYQGQRAGAVPAIHEEA